MKLKNSVKSAMEELGLKTLRKHQNKPIDSLLNGKDTLVIYPTSSGKSAIFQIPALVKAKDNKWTLVIEPTISLIHDQVKRLKDLGIAAEYITGNNVHKHDEILGKLNKLTFLYVTPERLQSSSFCYAVDQNNPWLVVVDEAHCVLDWGYTFRTSYLNIKAFIKSLKRRPVIVALTATAPQENRAVLCKLLGMKKQDIYTHDLNRENIILLREDCRGLTLKQRLGRINYNIKKYMRDGRTVIYCATRRYCDIVYNYLSDRFPGQVTKCHGFMDMPHREKHELQFIKGKKRIMVATTAFGMGVDVPDIRLVLHFNLPLSTIDYYQQIGRAGRDGNTSHAVMLYHPDDIELNTSLVKQQENPSVQGWLEKRLEEMTDIAQSEKCLTKELLHALGEEKPKPCGRCTNCQRNRRTLG